MSRLRYTIEPVLFLYSSSILLQYPVLQEYIYSWYSAEYGLRNLNETQTDSCIESDHNKTEKILQKLVQSQAASFNAGLTLCQSIPSIFTLFFYGSISDIIGRKPLMLLTSAMTTIYLTVTTITVVKNLHVKYIYIGAFVDGFGGSFSCMFMAVTTYIIDLTKKNELPMRFAIIESIVLFAFAGVYFSSGPLISKFSFIIIQLFISSLSCLSFFWVLLITKDSLNEDISSVGKRNFGVKSLLAVPKTICITLTNQCGKTWLIFLSITTLLFGYCITMPLLAYLMLYLLDSPLCFSASEAGYYIGTLLIGVSIGSTLGIKVGMKLFPEPVVALISCLCGSAHFTLLGFTQTKNILYTGLLFKSFSLMYMPIFRSLLSQAVVASSRGSMFSVLGSLEQALGISVNLFYSYIYTRMNNSGYPGYFFFIPALFLLIPLISTLLYWMKSRKDSAKNALKKPLISIEEASSCHRT